MQSDSPIIRLVGAFTSHRDLSDALPAAFYGPLTMIAGAVVAVFGMLDVIALMPR